MSNTRKLGLNAQKLLLRFMSREVIPDGGDFMDGVKFLLDETHRKQIMEKAMMNFDLAITAVRSAPDNTYGDDEEAIAEAILGQISKRENAT